MLAPDLPGFDDAVGPFTFSRAVDAQLRVRPAAGHLCNLEQPDLFATTVLDFLDRVVGRVSRS